VAPIDRPARHLYLRTMEREAQTTTPEPAPTTICMVCHAVLVQGAPGPVSHGLGPCCWDAYRAANGFAPKPYPVAK